MNKNTNTTNTTKMPRPGRLHKARRHAIKRAKRSGHTYKYIPMQIRGKIYVVEAGY